MNEKSSLEATIWNCTSTSNRESLVSHALIRIENEDSSRMPIQGLDMSLAKQDWAELPEEIQKRMEHLLHNVMATIAAGSSNVCALLSEESSTPLYSAIKQAVADAIVDFALRN